MAYGSMRINMAITKVTQLDKWPDDKINTSLYLLQTNATRFLNFYCKLLLASDFQAFENIYLNSRIHNNNQNLTIQNMYK